MTYDDIQAWRDVNQHFPHMTIYYVLLLKKRRTRSPDATPRLKCWEEMGKLVLNGALLDSFATSGEIRGIGVSRTSLLAEAQELIGSDPMVKAGRLIFELHTRWMKL